MSESEVVGSSRPQFRPFTRESLAGIEERIAADAEIKHQHKLHPESEEGEKHRDDDEGSEDQGPEANLEAGMPLPLYMQHNFPPELIATPIEDIDKFYHNQRTFVVVSKGKDIFRFSAHKALWLMDPFHPVRRIAIYVLVHPIFSMVVITTILINCILMTQPTSPFAEDSENYFTAIYTFESVTKMLARGFILDKFTYLRDPWNWLDFAVIALAYVTMSLGEVLGNLAVLRTFRVLRALKTVAIVPGLKTIVSAVIESVKNLKDVIILTVFSLSVFALFGLQVYMGCLRQKCVVTLPEEHLWNMSESAIKSFRNNDSNWYYKKNFDEPLVCGNASGATECPDGFTCYEKIGDNPNYGYTSFDSFGWALLSAFRLMTQDFWEDLYQLVLRSMGPMHMLFFIFIIFLGSFYLVNLILAIVAMSYDELQKRAELEEQEEQEILKMIEEENRLAAEGHAGGGGGGGGGGYSPVMSSNGELFLGQLVEDANKPMDKISLQSDGGDSIADQKGRPNGKVRKQQKRCSLCLQGSLSLPGSPFTLRRGSRGSHQFNWRTNGRRYGDKKPLVLSTFLDAQEHLPYADDSTAVTPMSEENGAIIIPGYAILNSRHNSYTSHCSRGSYTSHGDLNAKAFTKENQLRTRRNLQSLVPDVMDPRPEFESSVDSEDFLSKHKHCDNPFIDQIPTNPALDMKDVMVLNDIIEQAARNSRGSEHGVSIYYFPTDEEEDGPKWKERVVAKCLKCIDIFCVWNCCACWVKFQEYLCLFVYDPFVELFITLCIVVNTLFMAMDHHEMPDEMVEFLANGNYFFTATFAIECGMKLVAISPKNYFKEGWNIFDFFIVALSLVELSLEGVKGLSVLRSFRLLRVFKLAKSWPTLNMLISIMGKTVGALGNLTFVLGIIIFIFAVMGMQLFAENYRLKAHMFHGKVTPRWNFVDFLHSFMIVFRVLCGEWIQSMWDCLVVNETICLPFFLATVVIGNLVVLNLFLALLLSSFGASNLTNAPVDSDTNKLAEAIDRINRFVAWIKRSVRNTFSRAVKAIRAKMTNQIADQTADRDADTEDGGEILADGQIIMRDKKSDETLIKNKKKEIIANNKPLCNSVKKVDDNKEREHLENHLLCRQNKEKSEESLSNESYISKTHTTSSRRSSAASGASEGEEKKDIEKEEGDEVEEVNEEQEMGEEEAVEQKVQEGEEPKVPFICCLDICYDKIPWCAGKDTPFWDGWYNLRLQTLLLIENKYFETVVITCILISSMALALEDKYINHKKILKESLIYMDRVFTVLFFFEMLIKWLALGFRKYFTNAWCWLDFIIVLVVVNALVQAIPSIFNVLLVCLIFWLIFSIMAVQLLGGKFFKCINEENEKINASIISNKTECERANYTWKNSKINFDNVANGYLALFQVATFKGWIEILEDATDAKEKYHQPDYEANVYIYLFFVFFIIFGSFFTLNLFIGVIIDNFNEQKKKAGGSLEMFMTDDQKKYYNAMKKMGSKKPAKAIPRPRFRPQAIVFDITTDKKFDMFIMVFIGLNMIVMATDHYGQTDEFKEIVTGLNTVFIAVFTSECCLKIFALRCYYFKEPWNMFDFVVVILSILGVALKEMIENYFVSPTLLRVVRVVKVGRVLRLVKGAKGIRTLLFALAMSLPALFNICLLLFLVMFIYAIFGMSFFKTVKYGNGLDETFNFNTFPQSMILLFQMSTSAGWDGVLDPLMNEENCTLPDINLDEEGNCGNSGKAVVFLISYLVISFLIIINMYIAVILENYSQATEEVQEGLTDDDYDMYYEIWQRFDPDGTQYLTYEDLPEFLHELEEPLQIVKPNKYKIISMDIPICKNDLLYCVDILDALTKDFFARKGNPIEEAGDLGEVVKTDRPGYEVISSTLWRQREEFCARLIQKAWRKHRGKAHSTSSAADGPELQQTSIVIESDGHVTKNGHKVVIHSRSPSVTSRSTDV
uniref:Sodium channel protein n=1 Tax=Strigamia maritima TaxID=126957 RepID=T1JEU7_STRMM